MKKTPRRKIGTTVLAIGLTALALLFSTALEVAVRPMLGEGTVIAATLVFNLATVVLLLIVVLAIERNRTAVAERNAVSYAALYRLLLHGSHRAIWRFDPVGGDLTYSSEWEVLLGYVPGAFDGSLAGWVRRIPPSEAIGLGRLARQVLDGELELAETDVHYRHDDGRTGTLHVTACRDPRSRSLVGSFQDVTELRRVRELDEVRLAAQVRLDKLAEGLPGIPCTFHIDSAGRPVLVYVSTRFSRTFGVPLDTVIGDPEGLIRGVHRDDREPLLKKLAVAEKTRHPVSCELRFETPQGTTWFELTAVTEAGSNGERVWNGYLHDVNLRRTISDALVQSERCLQGHLKGVPIGVLSINADGIITDINPATPDLTNRPRSQLIGQPLAGLFHTQDLVKVEAALRGSQERTLLRLRHPDQSIRRVRVHTSNIGADRLVWMEDVTAERLSQDCLEAQLFLLSGAPQHDTAMTVDRALDAIGRYSDSPVVWLWMSDHGLEEVFVWSRSRPRATPPRKDIVAAATAIASEGRPHVSSGDKHELLFPQAVSEGCSLVFGVSGREDRYSTADLTLVGTVARTLAGAVSAAHDHHALIESERNLNRAEAIAKIGSWTLDLRTDVLMWSNGVRRLLSSPPEARPSLAAMAAWLHPNEPEALERLISEVVTHGRVETEHAVTLAGAAGWVRHRIELERDPHGRILRTTGTLQDITEPRQNRRKLEDTVRSLQRSEEALSLHRRELERRVADRTAAAEAAERLTRQILEATAEGIVSLDLAGGVTLANQSACKMLQRSLEEIVGRNFVELVSEHAPPDQRVGPDSSPIRQAIQSGREQRVDADSFWLADGRELPVTYTVRTMGTDDTTDGAVLTFADITARRIADAALRRARDEAQRLADMRSSFLANMSHELRTPLNTVLGLAQIGRRDYLSSPAGESFTHIVEAGQLLLSLVNGILDYSKIEAGKLELSNDLFSLGEVLDRALELATAWSDKGLEIRVQEDPALPARMRGDALRLTQILVNLLSNAVKFTEAAGWIDVTLKRDRERKDVLVIRVTDTGIGMSEEQLQRLFLPFEQADATTTRRFGGSGLGLSICKDLVSQLGGDISASSQLGLGSTFVVSLPIRDPEPAPPTPPRLVATCGLRPEEHWVVDALRERGARVAGLGPNDDLLPDILLLDGATALDPEIWSWVERLQRAGGRVIVVTSGDNTRWTGRNVEIVTRPLRARQVLDSRRSAAPMGGRNRLQGLRVLGVEDAATNRLVLESILTDEGARLVCMEDGLSAIDLLTSQGRDAFDVVLTDISMPGIDGYETCRRIRMISKTLPVYALTAHALPGDRERCLAAGMDGFITKPIDLEALVQALLPYANPALRTTTNPPHRNTLPPTVMRPTAQSPQLVDWDRLARELPGGEAFLFRLAEMAADTQGNVPSLLREAVAARDYDAVRRLAHDLVGLAGAFRVTPLVELAKSVQASARASTPQSLALAVTLADSADELFNQLRSRLELFADSQGLA